MTESGRPYLVAALAVWALAIAIIDIWRLRVPNVLLLLVAAPAVLIQLIDQQGLLGITVLQALEGLGLGFGLLILGHVSGKVGAGDVKYAGLIGFLIGLLPMIQVLLMSGLLLGLVSLLAYVEARFYKTAGRKLPAGACLSLALVLNLLGVSIAEGVGNA